MDYHEPDIHYTSSINLEFLDGLGLSLQEAIDTIPENLDDPAISARFVWEICRQNWIENIEYAKKRLAKIYASRLANLANDTFDRKIISICLCIIRDFKQAQTQGFKDTPNAHYTQ